MLLFSMSCEELLARLGFYLRQFLDRDRDAGAGALAPPRRDLDAAAELRHSLAHAEQPERARVAQLRLADAPTVAAPLQHHAAAGLAQQHLHLGRGSMPRHVGEQLLEDAEQRGRALLVDAQLLRREIDVAADARAHLEFL